nr:MAG TPA: hypothetical protein [Caudoviricetes sp.]DAW18600.1 MAG TPA: hypothetical protein [Caudoviricetes sp.]
MPKQRGNNKRRQKGGKYELTRSVFPSPQR